jgi:hypothetical protein
MPYIARETVKGKGYAVYKGSKGVKTKAALLKDALKIAHGDDYHEAWLDFIPAKFTLQVHGWLSEGSPLKNLEMVEAVIKQALKAGKDPALAVNAKQAKCHYDLRVQKTSSASWFGLTPFRAPWTGTKANKVMGTVKGYQSLAPGAKELGKFLREQAERQMAKEGIAERRDRLEWMKIKNQWFSVGSPGNPQKNIPAFMIAIEFYKPACIHRRELDFYDITFFGDYLKGRFYNRLVERKESDSEIHTLGFYFWKADHQWGSPNKAQAPYSMEQVLKAALGKITLEKKPVPKNIVQKETKAKVVDTTKEFH